MKATDGPVLEFPSSLQGAYDSIDGKVNPANPGSLVDDSVTFDTTSPAAKLTVTWHLVHDGPIILSHN